MHKILSGNVLKSLEVEDEHIGRRPNIHLLDWGQVLLAIRAVEGFFRCLAPQTTDIGADTASRKRGIKYVNPL
jgi:hypothetical protein